jgi:hypothetical protein
LLSYRRIVTILQMRRSLQIAAAVVGAAITFSKPIIKLIDRLSEMDFLATYAGAVGRFLETGWGTLTSVCIGTAIIGFSIYHGLKHQKASSPSGQRARLSSVTMKPDTAIATRQKEESDTIFYPRYERIDIPFIDDPAILLDRSRSSQNIALTIDAVLNEETHEYLDELISVLGRERIGAPRLSAREELNLNRRIRELLVLFKGNDVAIYADNHYKFLPEQWDEPKATDPAKGIESQLILVAGPPPQNESKTIEVEVDNGHPRTLSRNYLPF